MYRLCTREASEPQSGQMAEVCVDVTVMVMLCAVTSTLFTSNSFGKASSGLTFIFFEPSFYKSLFIHNVREIGG
jgi:hypothetical protein